MCPDNALIWCIQRFVTGKYCFAIQKKGKISLSSRQLVLFWCKATVMNCIHQETIRYIYTTSYNWDPRDFASTSWPVEAIWGGAAGAGWLPHGADRPWLGFLWLQVRVAALEHFALATAGVAVLGQL
jgi:hypothetical protein